MKCMPDFEIKNCEFLTDEKLDVLDSDSLFIWGKVLFNLKDDNFDNMVNKMVTCKNPEVLKKEDTSSALSKLKSVVQSMKNNVKYESVYLEDDHILNKSSAKNSDDYLPLPETILKLDTKYDFFKREIKNPVTDDNDLIEKINFLIENTEVKSYQDLIEKLNSFECVKCFSDDILNDNEKDPTIDSKNVFEYRGYYFNVKNKDTIKQIFGLVPQEKLELYCKVPDEVYHVRFNGGDRLFEEICMEFCLGIGDSEIERLYQVLEKGYITNDRDSNSEFKLIKKGENYYLILKNVDEKTATDDIFDLNNFRKISSCFCNISDCETNLRIYDQILENVKNIIEIQ